MLRPDLHASPTLLRETALPHLQDLVLATGHTVHLAALDGMVRLTAAWPGAHSGKAKNSSAMPSGSRKEIPLP